MQRVEQVGDAIVIYVKDHLDLASAASLNSSIELAKGNERQRIVVSLEGCGFCDSAGLSVLVRAHKRHGSRFFVVLSDEAPCRRSFSVTGLATLIQLVPTVQRALDVGLGAA
jgi:anti-anti-sigma factor